MIMNHLQPTAGIFLAAVVLLSNSHVNVNAAYPSSLIWSDCGQDKCATLEFCKDGTNYGKFSTQQLVDKITSGLNLNYFSCRSAFFAAALLRYYCFVQVIAIQEISLVAVANQVLSFEWHQATHTNLPSTTLRMIRPSTQTFTLTDYTSLAAEMAMILPDLLQEAIASIIHGTFHGIIRVARIGITHTITLSPTIRLREVLSE